MERFWDLRRVCKLFLILLLTALLAACGGESIPNPTAPGPSEPGPSEPEPTDPGGTYTDPGTPPPDPITNPTMMTSGALAVSDKAQGLITLSVAGFSVDETGESSTVLNSAALAATLEPEDFTLVENGIVQGISVDTVEAGDNVPIDIAFVIDTTFTMEDALESVQDGIISFGGALESSGLDVRLGAVTFGDAFDTLGANSSGAGVSLTDKTPPAFDRDERPSLALTDDLLSFQTFIAGETPRGGGDTPENVLGALAFAHRNFEWREGAQRILVVVTDTCSHTEITNYFIPEPWAPENFEDVLAELRARATVHVISDGGSCRRYKGSLNMEAFTGAEGTGGMFHEWNGGDFDLAEVGLSQTMTSNYLITYQGDLTGEEQEVRLVIDNGDTVRGELTLRATY